MTTAARRARRLIPVAALIGVGALALSACSAGGDASSSDSSGEFTYLGQTENTTIVDTLTTLSGSECTAEEEAAPLTSDTCRVLSGRSSCSFSRARTLCRISRCPPARLRSCSSSSKTISLSTSPTRSTSSEWRTGSCRRRSPTSRPSTVTARCTLCRQSSTSKGSGTTRRFSPTTASRRRPPGTTSSTPPRR